MTLIHRKFSPQCDSSGQFVQMRNTAGTQTYPVVKAKIELDGHSYEIDVAVSEQLQEDALLAREQLGPSETSYAVTTRAQVQQQKTQTEKSNPSIGERFPFDNSLFDTGRKHKGVPN